MWDKKYKSQLTEKAANLPQNAYKKGYSMNPFSVEIHLFFEEIFFEALLVKRWQKMRKQSWAQILCFFPWDDSF